MRDYLKILLVLAVLTIFVAACNTPSADTGNNGQQADDNAAGEQAEDNSDASDASVDSNMPALDSENAEETVVEDDNDGDVPMPNVAAEASAKSLGMDKLYNYGMLKNYEYRVTSTAGGVDTVTNMKYGVTSDPVNGVAAWKTSVNIESQGATITSNTWLSKANYKCLKITTTINAMGQNIDQEAECPQEGPNAVSSPDASMPQLQFVGSESVTVPAGTFSAEKYQLESVMYWYSSGVPLPIKVTYTSAQVSTAMELVSYS